MQLDELRAAGHSEHRAKQSAKWLGTSGAGYLARAYLLSISSLMHVPIELGCPFICPGSAPGPSMGRMTSTKQWRSRTAGSSEGDAGRSILLPLTRRDDLYTPPWCCALTIGVLVFCNYATRHFGFDHEVHARRSPYFGQEG